MTTDALARLAAFGQSYWLDDLTREQLDSGELATLVAGGLSGVTSNPSTFHDAVMKSTAYDEHIRAAAGRGCTPAALYEELTTDDVRRACDLLRPMYDATDGADGFVSLEVSPHLAHDAAGSCDEARRFAARVDRPNLMIKIPGTREGLVAIEELLWSGINVNVTLLFSVRRYQEVALAWLRALERRAAAGLPIDRIASVASFFLSRIDVAVDELLGHRIGPDGTSPYEPHPRTLRGRAAIASARRAYAAWRRICSDTRWQALSRAGARSQRLLWASTGTKNPEYSDVLYVEALIGPETINTLPLHTLRAFAEHGRAAATLATGTRETARVLAGLRRVGIDLTSIAERLEDEGIAKFIRAYDGLLRTFGERLARERQREGSREGEARLETIARRLRRDCVRMTTAAGSGHPSSCLSAADLVAAIFFHAMRWDPTDSRRRDVDAFILSKGHAAPLLWAALAEAGAIHEDLLSLRKLSSTLEGHPTPRNEWVRVATGSLGQGLPAAAGYALANRLDGIEARVYCLLGDGECAEGSVWEAAQLIALEKLAGVVAIVDANGLGQSGPTPWGRAGEALAARFASFGWRVISIDGHDMGAILDALGQAAAQGPTAIVARTVKGKGVADFEGREGWHGKPLDEAQCERALAALGPAEGEFRVNRRHASVSAPRSAGADAPTPAAPYEIGAQIATREAFGVALRDLGASMQEIVVLDADVSNSTYTDKFAKRFPGRFVQCYIAEQAMAGAALGLAACGKLPVAATFACFLTRAFDFIRMASHSRPPRLVFCGSHAGVSIGEDGPSQMGLEDIAMFRSLSGVTVLSPCDGTSARHITELALRSEGIVYIRTARPKTPVIYDANERFETGGSKLLRSSPGDRVTLVATGVTVHEALRAHEKLAARGVATRVVDAYSIVPLDADALERCARETGLVITIEDHHVDGGLGDAVAAAVSALAPVVKLGVSVEPRSGTMQELLDLCGISADAIERAVIAALGPVQAAQRGDGEDRPGSQPAAGG